jgi:hypothetical protein
MWSQSVQLKNHKKITIRQGNICTTEEVFDLLFCSAFKRDYLPVEGTLIGNLMIQKGISVEQLAEKPRLDFRDGRDCWVSEPVKGNIRRVACIELLDYEKREDAAMMQSVILKNMFSSVCFLLEQANREGLTLRRVALPILGAGNQGLEICYVIPPLLAQCMQALHTIPQLEEIVFYEMDENKAHKLYEGLTRALDRSHAGEDVFISYSSAQRTLADALRSYLEKHGISCWMAPYSIPSGSSYQAEIPAALNRTAAVVLLLSEDSEKSSDFLTFHQMSYNPSKSRIHLWKSTGVFVMSFSWFS